MKFTVVFFNLLLTISSTWALKEKKQREDLKGKRESSAGYESVGPPAHSFQGSSIGNDGGNAISIGAGYSFGGGNPQYNFDNQGQRDLQLQFAQESQPSSHANLQLPPITLQPGQGMDDLAKLMSQITQGLNSGQISLQSLESPNSIDATSYQSLQQGQAPQFSFGQYNFDGPKQQQQQYSVTEQSQDGGAQSFSNSPKDVSAFSSSGPVLFNPAGDTQHKQQQTLTYNQPPVHSFGQGNQASFGSHPGLTLFGSSLGGSGSLLGNTGHSGNQAFSFASHGPALSFKGFGSGRYVVPSKSSFKPSAYLGTSLQGDSSHGLSEHTPSFSGPHLNSNHGGLSLGSSAYSAGFGGFGGGSSKYISPLQFPSKLAFAAFSPKGQFSSPPGTTYGTPVGSHGLGSGSHGLHSASSHTPMYVRPSKHVSAFGEGSSSFQGPSGHVRSLMSSHSGPKFSFGPSSRFVGVKDVEGAYSDSTYNTIKYSEELKPHVM